VKGPPRGQGAKEFDLSRVRRPGYLARRLPTLKRSVNARLGDLVAVGPIALGRARSYVLTICCVREHQFQLSSKDLLRGAWCTACAEIDRRELLKAALERMKRHAKRQGGKCLATSYESARKPVPWECRKGHRWLAPWDNICNHASWCAVCARGRAHRSKA